MKTLSTSVDALLSAIVESSDDAIISKNLDGIITSWNKGAERIFGYSAEEAIGKPIAIIASPERNEMPAILERLRRGERIDHYETVRQTKDGRRVDISLTVSPIHDGSGRIVGASKIARDITERKLAEAAVLKQSEQLSRANADLQQFAYITSHDLQEPLRTVQACTEMFLKKSGQKVEAADRELLDLAVNAARRMSDMIRDLLTYARSNDGDLPFTTVKISDIVKWAENNLHLAIQSSGAQIIYDPYALPVVRGNPLGLVQLFQNLLSNAIKYRGAEPPRVEISAERRSGQWLFSVRDNGIGISKAYHKRIFFLFQRLHTASEYPGTGIGLTLCKRIVQTHGGEIWVESEAGQGANFMFTLAAEEAE